MKKQPAPVAVRYQQTRILGLLPSISLVAQVQALASDGLMLRWRSVPQSQSNFGYQRSREVRNVYEK